LKAVLRLRDQETGEESSESQGQSKARGYEGGAHAEEGDAQCEQLPVLQQHHPIQDPGDHHPPRQHQTNDDEKARPNRGPDARYRTRIGMGEDGNQKHQRNDTKILKEQDRHHDAPRWTVQLDSVGVDLQNDRRRGKGNQGSVEQGAVPGDAEPEAGSGRGHEQRAYHLERPTLEYEAPEPYDASQGELEPDRKKEEHHPELRQLRHGIGSRDEREPMGTDSDSGDEEPGDGGQPDTVGEGRDRDRYRQQDHEIPKNV
jgi:hypothetical protein